ncbi:MAG: insulinase family protein [Paludibacteraceae bacterium]|nr:insulinase family protein [Paludibacteraceae bacterium]
MKCRILTAVVLLAGILPMAAQPAGEGWAAPLPTDSATRVGRLPNGLTYYVHRNTFQKQRADFYLAQRVGSVLEEPNQRGLAHFLEHMAFDGSRHFPGKEMTHYLETVGVKFGENLNAYTSIDETVYNICEVPVDRSSTIDSCLLVLRDWSDGILLEDDAIDRERRVIEEEWRSTESSSHRMYDQLLPIVYAGTPYADCRPIGHIDVIRHFDYGELRSYYRRWYRPDLQAVMVVGDVDPDDMEARIQAAFADDTVPENAPERVYFPVPDPVLPKIALTQDKEASYVVVSLNWMQPDRPRTYWNTAPGLLERYLNQWIAAMMNLRLYELQQTEDPPFSEVKAGFEPLFVSQVRSSWKMLAVTSGEQCAKAFKALLTEQERMRRYGFTQAEFDRAGQEILSQMRHAFSERDQQRNEYYVQQCLDHFLESQAMVGMEQELEFADAVSRLPLERVNDYVRRLDALPPIVWLRGPQGGWMPDSLQITVWMDSVRKADIQPYQDTLSEVELIPQLPEEGRVVRQRAGAFGSTELLLSNGVRVVVKPTVFKPDEIRMQAYSPGGFSREDVHGDAVTLNLIDDLTDLGGVGGYSLTELTKLLFGKQVVVDLSVRPYSETLTATSTVHDLETMFQLVYLYFTAIRRDETAFRSYADRLSALLANQELNPMTEYRDSLVSVLYHNHPLHQRVRSGDLALLDYDRGLEILRRRFSDASDFTFYISGRVDVDSLRPLLTRYLAVLPAAGGKETVGPVDFLEVPGQRTCRYSKPMEHPKTMVMLSRFGPMKYNLKNQLTMSMLEQVLQIVCMEQLREEEGGIYSMRVSAHVSRLPAPRYDFRIQFVTDSSKVDRLLPVVAGEMQRIAGEGPREKDLQKVREYMNKVYNDRQIDNDYWIGALLEKDLSGIDQQSRWLQVMQSVSARDIQRAARRVLDSPNVKQVIQVGVAR